MWYRYDFSSEQEVFIVEYEGIFYVVEGNIIGLIQVVFKEMLQMDKVYGYSESIGQLVYLS